MDHRLHGGIRNTKRETILNWDKQQIIELLLRAGDVAREARKKLSLQFKADRSLVTQADTEI